MQPAHCQQAPPLSRSSFALPCPVHPQAAVQAREDSAQFDVSRLVDFSERLLLECPAAQLTPLVREPGRWGADWGLLACWDAGCCSYVQSISAIRVSAACNRMRRKATAGARCTESCVRGTSHCPLYPCSTCPGRLRLIQSYTITACSCTRIHELMAPGSSQGRGSNLPHLCTSLPAGLWSQTGGCTSSHCTTWQETRQCAATRWWL